VPKNWIPPMSLQLSFEGENLLVFGKPSFDSQAGRDRPGHGGAFYGWFY
jgi:hypothetical protein